MEAVGEPHGEGSRTPGALVPALGRKVYQMARSELGSPHRRWRGRGRLQQKHPSAVVKTRENWQKEIAVCPPGTLPASGPNKGAVGRSPTGMQQDLGGLPGRDPTPPRDTLN